jgi:hypothetical protein
MKNSRSVIVLFAVLLSLGGTLSALAAKRAREIDLLWTRPDAASLKIESIAMLPAASYENVPPAERNAEAELMKSIRGAGYRWITAPTAREMLRHSSGDSLLKSLRQSILDHGRVDSLNAPALCRLLRVDGLIAVRVERAEQTNIQSDQSGKPSTTVQVKATLVDSLGRLVWLASGVNTLEGAYLEAAPTGSSAMQTQLGNSATQTRTNAPDWALALEPLYLRWVDSFPHRASLAPGADPRPDSSKAH